MISAILGMLAKGGKFLGRGAKAAAGQFKGAMMPDAEGRGGWPQMLMGGGGRDEQGGQGVAPGASYNPAPIPQPGMGFDLGGGFGDMANPEGGMGFGEEMGGGTRGLNPNQTIFGRYARKRKPSSMYAGGDGMVSNLLQ